MPGDYGNTSYWDERYAAENTMYDWYQDYSEVSISNGVHNLFKLFLAERSFARIFKATKRF